MTSTTAKADSLSAIRLPQWARQILVAGIVSAFVLALHAANGFPQLSDARGDNDGLLRMVQVRDLLSGQGWFDLHQYRLGIDGGTLMHWSRLVDAPSAGIVLAVVGLGGDAMLAETVARVLWPALLFALALFAIMRIAQSLGGDWTMLPAASLGAAALYFVNIFRPGALDHHNLQIVLTLAIVAFLARPRVDAVSYGFAGLCAALMLAIGMEAIPFVAVTGVYVALVFVVHGPRRTLPTAAFATALTGGVAVAFLATAAPGSWLVEQCDALSSVHLVIGATSGLGLTAISFMKATNATLARRITSSALLGAAIVVTAAIAFPQCLESPFAAIDPTIREFWLNRVSEVQSFIDLAAGNWTQILIYYATPALALGVYAARLIRNGPRERDLVYAAFLAAAFAVSLWQLRGSMFSIPLASIGLAVFIGGWRERLDSRYSLPSSFAMLTVWLLSFNIVWGFAGNGLNRYMKGDAAPAQKANCYSNAGFANLAGLPTGMVLAVTDLGAPILFNTAHSVLAGPYHRNVEGNMLMMRMMTAREETSEALARANGVDYVLLCRGNGETSNYAEAAPQGLLADLVAGRVPRWLEREPGTAGEPIEIYRMVAR
jgi:asparagine N-glycosylation enzyme membrane subunit Stt3